MATESWALAIDFGTSRSAGAMFADGVVTALEVEGNRWMPSLVLADEEGNLLVGTAADNQAGVFPDRVERTPKRHLGSGAPLVLGDATVDVIDAVAAVLRVFVDEGRLRRGGTPPDAVVLTHPVRWADERRDALVEAARRAGLPEPLLVEEPVAAAVHYVSDQVAPGQYVGVYDLGGGTFDTAVLLRTETAFEVVGTPGGDEFIGGEDFDHRLFQFFGQTLEGFDAELWDNLCVSDERKYRRAALDLIVQARRAKEALSTWTSTQVFVPIADRDLVVNRSQFEAMIIDDIERTVDLMDDTIASAGITGDQLALLYLVGGSSRLPLVVQLLTERFGDRVTTRDEPKGVVALGAAKIAGGLLATRAAPEAAPPTTAPAPSPSPSSANADWPVPDGAPPSPSQPPAPGSPLPTTGFPATSMPYPGAAGPGGAMAPRAADALVGLRRLGDRFTERTRAVLAALATPATDASSSVPLAPVAHGVPNLAVAPNDLRNPDVRWRVQLPRLAGQLASDGTNVYFGTDDGELRAIDALTGESRWQVTIAAPSAQAPTLHGALLLAGGADGVVNALGTEGQWYWRASLGAAISAPVLASGQQLVACTTNGRLFGIDRASGATQWQLAFERSIDQLVAVSPSTALLATADGQLVHFHVGSGAVLWQSRLPGAAALDVAADLAIVASIDGTVRGLDVTTGTVRWTCTIGNATVGSIAHDASFAYVAGADGHVYAIDLRHGVAAWKWAAAGSSSGGCVVTAGALHIDSGAGELRVLDLATPAVRWRVATGDHNRCRPLRVGAMVVIGTPYAQIFGLFDQR